MRHGLVITTRDCARVDSMRNFIRELCPAVFYTYGGYGEPMFLVTVIVLFFDGRLNFNFKPSYTNKKSPATAGLRKTEKIFSANNEKGTKKRGEK